MEIIEAFLTVVQPMNILFLVIGVTAGLIVGAIPGLTATLAISLLLPFTFALSPEPALIMLLGIYIGGTCGGAFTAILIRAPGTPGAVATSLDGYPMTQKGKAGLALGTAVIASVVGSIIGVLLMVLLSPVISKAALSFSSAEFFALAVFGLIIIFTISGENMLKGIISGVLGLLFLLLVLMLLVHFLDLLLVMIN